MPACDKHLLVMPAPRFYTAGMLRLLISLTLLVSANAIAATPVCGDKQSPQLTHAQFTSAVRSQAPQDNLYYLPPDSREVFVHATTQGAGKITYRWFRDGKRVMDVGVAVGTGEWRTWSRLRLPPPVPSDVRVEIIGTDNCRLREMTLAAAAFVDHPQISKAWRQIATGDATGAKITLKILLEETPARSPLGRTAKRMLDLDVAVAQARERAGGDELFLVEPALVAVEKKLGRKAADRALRERIAGVRALATARAKQLSREGALMALATMRLLETQKLFDGDYPLLRDEAEKVVLPALAHAGGTYTLLDWQPTLRSYRLVLQDKRSGAAIEVTPE
jgi:hypothetical protein